MEEEHTSHSPPEKTGEQTVIYIDGPPFTDFESYVQDLVQRLKQQGNEVLTIDLSLPKHHRLNEPKFTRRRVHWSKIRAKVDAELRTRQTYRSYTESISHLRPACMLPGADVIIVYGTFAFQLHEPTYTAQRIWLHRRTDHVWQSAMDHYPGMTSWEKFWKARREIMHPWKTHRILPKKGTTIVRISEN
jgi:hypothetical protein